MAVDGKYEIVTKTPMGDQKATLTLVASGPDLSGTMAGAQGSIDFSGGSVDGDTATWALTLQQPMKIDLTFTATIEGDAITGQAKTAAFGAFPFSGTRV